MKKDNRWLRGGKGVRVAEVQGGAVVTAIGKSRPAHPWQAVLAEEGIVIAAGLVDGVIPIVKTKDGKKPLGGTTGEPMPILQLSTGLVDENGRSWIVVEVEFSEPKKGAEVLSAEVKQVDKVKGSGTKGAYPIVLLKLKNGKWSMWQLAHFNVKHWYRDSASAEMKHFFVSM